MRVVFVVVIALELQGQEWARIPRARASAVNEGPSVDVVCPAAALMNPKLVIIFCAGVWTPKTRGPGAGQAQANSV